jgi:molybdopterin synthase sulfur carrier subunit
MIVTVRYFASLREALGPGEAVEIAADSAKVGALRDALIARGGAHAQTLARGRAVRMALDQQLCDDESAPLRDGAEVAFFPPVTGG